MVKSSDCFIPCNINHKIDCYIRERMSCLVLMKHHVSTSLLRWHVTDLHVDSGSNSNGEKYPRERKNRNNEWKHTGAYCNTAPLKKNGKNILSKIMYTHHCPESVPAVLLHKKMKPSVGVCFITSKLNITSLSPDVSSTPQDSSRDWVTWKGQR